MIDPKLLSELPEQAKLYWTRAQEFLTKNSVAWESLEVPSPEYEEWVRYFQWSGFKPRMIAMAERGTIRTIVVPARHPEWFDSKFVGSNRVAHAVG